MPKAAIAKPAACPECGTVNAPLVPAAQHDRGQHLCNCGCLYNANDPSPAIITLRKQTLPLRTTSARVAGLLIVSDEPRQPRYAVKFDRSHRGNPVAARAI